MQTTKDLPLGSRYCSKKILPSVPLAYSQYKLSRLIRGKIKDRTHQFVALPCLCKQQSPSVLLAEVDRFNLPSNTVLCMACGLIRTDPRMDDALLNEFYTRYYHELYHGNESFDELFDCQYTHGEVIAKFTALQPSKEKLVLEIGTGPGGILAAFSKLGFSVLGSEIDSNAAEFGFRKAGTTIRVGDIDSLLDQTGKADLIVLSHVLEHLSEPKEVLKKIRTLLKPNGFLYIEVPGVKSLASGQQGMCGGSLDHPHNKDFLEYLRSTHLWSFELRTLELLVQSCGFSIEKGDELVRVLLKKSDIEKNLNWGKNKGAEVLSFLKELELLRKKHDLEHLPTTLKFWTRTLVSWGLRMTGIRR